jgi:multiple sugar transport system substrate-binding protein/sn-glycerol 3-phosphate transport system substrate-binding protein
LSTPGADADLEAFSAGRVAMIFAKESKLREIVRAVKERGGFRWDMTPVPYGQQPITLDVNGRSWLVMRSTSEKQLAAWLFARWFAEPEQTLAWALGTGQLPLRASAADLLRREHGEDPMMVAALDLLPFAHAAPLVSYWPAVMEAATRAVLAVVAGDAPELAHGQARDAIHQLVAP